MDAIIPRIMEEKYQGIHSELRFRDGGQGVTVFTGEATTSTRLAEAAAKRVGSHLPDDNPIALAA